MKDLKFKAQNKETGEWKVFSIYDLVDRRKAETYMWYKWQLYTGDEDKKSQESIDWKAKYEELDKKHSELIELLCNECFDKYRLIA